MNAEELHDAAVAARRRLTEREPQDRADRIADTDIIFAYVTELQQEAARQEKWRGDTNALFDAYKKRAREKAPRTAAEQAADAQTLVDNARRAVSPVTKF